MVLEIRAASSCEFGAVSALAGALHLHIELEREFVLEQSRNLVLFLEGELVGVSLFWVLHEEAELLDIGISPMHQGQGLGRKLLEETLNQLRMAGVAKVFLEVRARNVRARKLYESAAFVASFVRKGYYQDGDDAVVYELILS